MTQDLATIQQNAGLFVMSMFGRAVEKKLGAGATVQDYIHDFVNSDDPRFEGKSKKERIRMALGAFYARKGLMKANDCHLPGGTPAGGQFCSDGGSGGGSSSGAGLPYANRIREAEAKLNAAREHKAKLVRGGVGDDDDDLRDANRAVNSAMITVSSLRSQQRAALARRTTSTGATTGHSTIDTGGRAYGSEAEEAAASAARSRQAAAAVSASAWERILAADPKAGAPVDQPVRREPYNPNQRPGATTSFYGEQRYTPGAQRPERSGLRQQAFDAATTALGTTGTVSRTAGRVLRSTALLNNIVLGVRGVVGAKDFIDAGHHLSNLRQDISLLRNELKQLPADARMARTQATTALRVANRTLQSATRVLSSRSGQIALGGAVIAGGTALNNAGLGAPQRTYASAYRRYATARYRAGRRLFTG